MNDGNIHIRCMADGDGTRGEGAAEWLRIIWEINHDGGDREVFSNLKIEEWWAGGTVEEYEHARVIHRGDGTVSVCGKSERGDRALRQAAEALGIRTTEQVSVYRLERSDA